MGKKTLAVKIIGCITMLLLLLTTASLIYTILLYNGIENFLRIMLAIILALITNLFIGTLLISIKDSRFKTFITMTVISLIFAICYSVGAYYLFVAYSKINNFNKETITHETALISKSKDYKINNLKNTKIGIIDDTENIEGYILPQELIEKYKLKETNEFIEYSDNLTLMNALYTSEVDLIFTSSNYVDLFESVEGFEEIEKEVHLIESYGKDYKKSDIEEESTSGKKLDEPISILLLGVDSAKDGLAANASFNGDTIMVITFDPNTLNATMFSIPRDTFVPMACGGSSQKITHAAWGGTNCMVKTVEKLTGIDIDYYVKINFKGVVALVDAVGGITVDVPIPDYPEAYCLDNSDRKTKTMCLTPGLQKLDGEHALALARVRKAFALGDFQRGQNQQLIVEALVKELKNIRSVNKFYEVLDAVSKNIDTNMTTSDMLSFYEVGKSLLFSNDNNVLNIQKTFLRGYSLTVYEPSSSNYSYTFQYYKGSLNDIVDAMKENLGLKEKDIVKEISFSINEPYEKAIIGDSYYSESKLPLVPDFSNGYSVDSAKSWGDKNGITINVEEITSGEMFNSAYPTGKIVGQSVHEDTLPERVKGSITIYVIKNDYNFSTNPEPEVPNEDEQEQTLEIPGLPSIDEPSTETPDNNETEDDTSNESTNNQTNETTE